MVISSTKNEEMSSGVDEKEMQRQSKRQQAKPDFRYALRKFRNHSENFTILAKFSSCTNFR